MTARTVSPSQNKDHTGAAIPGRPHRLMYQLGMRPLPSVDMPTIVIPMAPARPALKRPESASSRWMRPSDSSGRRAQATPYRTSPTPAKIESTTHTQRTRTGSRPKR